MGFRVSGSGFRVQGVPSCRDWGLGFRVWSFRACLVLGVEVSLASTWFGDRGLQSSVFEMQRIRDGGFRVSGLKV